MLQAILGIVLHALELHLELLIAVLKLFDCAGELAERTFHAVEPYGEIARIRLCYPVRWRGLGRLSRLTRRLTTIEQIVEEIARPALILRRRSAAQQQRGERGEYRDTK